MKVTRLEGGKLYIIYPLKFSELDQLEEDFPEKFKELREKKVLRVIGEYWYDATEEVKYMILYDAMKDLIHIIVNELWAEGEALAIYTYTPDELVENFKYYLKE